MREPLDIDLVADTAQGYAPRGEEIAQIREAVAQARADERERRVRRCVTVFGGWVFGGAMTLVAAASLAVVWHRPAPRDHLAVAMMRPDGVIEPPVYREDLPKAQSELLVQHTLIQYVTARESYVWEGLQRDYNAVSAMSAPDERQRYQGWMANQREATNPMTLYGSGLNATKVVVAAVRIRPHPDTPNQAVADILLRVTPPAQPSREVRKLATLTWIIAPNLIPLNVQQFYDPAALAVTYYSSDLDQSPTAP